MLVRGAEGERQVRAELLKASFALRASAVRVHQTANRRNVARLVLGNCGADLGNSPDDLVAGNNRVDGGHELAPLVVDHVEIGVADAAEKDLDLDIVRGRIAAFDLRRGAARGRTGRRIGFRIEHELTLLVGEHQPEPLPPLVIGLRIGPESSVSDFRNRLSKDN